MKKLIQISFFVFVMTMLSTACEEEPTDCIDPAQIDTETSCIEIYDPVCGCDDVTYDNECYATIAGVTSWTAGPCEVACIGTPNLEVVCIALFDPVCGCDGVTYGNSCEAENWGGVTSWTQGVCP